MCRTNSIWIGSSDKVHSIYTYSPTQSITHGIKSGKLSDRHKGYTLEQSAGSCRKCLHVTDCLPELNLQRCCVWCDHWVGYTRIVFIQVGLQIGGRKKGVVRVDLICISKSNDAFMYKIIVYVLKGLEN